MSTPFYIVAHQLLPQQAAAKPAEVWASLSGPDWSMWLAMVGHALDIKVRGIGVEGVTTGAAVQVRDGIEMIAVYFPRPEAPGEPFFAILARRPGANELRSFVFELGISDPGEALRVVMAEWQTLPTGTMRVRFDVRDDPSLETCLRRTASVMNEVVPVRPRPPITLAPMALAPMASRSSGMLSLILMISVAMIGVLGLGALAFYLLMKM